MQHTSRPPASPELEPELDPDSEAQSSLVLRFGTAVGGGVAAALAASLPAALRIGDGGSLLRAIPQWLALAALAVPLGVFAVGVFRRAKVGFRILVGSDRAVVLGAGVVWWAVLQLGVLAVLGALLRKNTHHHGLAGATFAMMALASACGVGMIARRLVILLARYDETIQRICLGIASVAAFLALILTGTQTSHTGEVHTSEAVVDVFALAVASAIASSNVFTRLRPLAIASVPAAVAVIVMGLAVVRTMPEVRDAVAASAPLQHAVLETFTGKSSGAP